jgi:pyruvate-formate lyase-activating enzyme
MQRSVRHALAGVGLFPPDDRSVLQVIACTGGTAFGGVFVLSLYVSLPVEEPVYPLMHYGKACGSFDSETRTSASARGASRIQIRRTSEMTYNPDVKIILPGGCNARCSFCFGGKNWGVFSAPSWGDRMKKLLNSLPPEFCQLNITGGEPTISENFQELIHIVRLQKERWPKVVLSTNGSYSDLDLSGSVDHVNISRHHYEDRANWDIFGTTTTPSTGQLKRRIRDLSVQGIDVTLSMVIQGCWDRDGILLMVEYCKSVGAVGLTIRTDYRIGLEESRTEKSFSHLRSVRETGCPVCHTKVQIIEGLFVTWSRGVLEPTAILPPGEVFEVIIQPDCSMTLDYAGNLPYEIPMSALSNVLWPKMDSCIRIVRGC